MRQILGNAAVCPHCGTPGLPVSKMDPHRESDADTLRYDIEALATEAADERAFDETTKIRVTQQDIRKLLEKRMKAAK